MSHLTYEVRRLSGPVAAVFGRWEAVIYREYPETDGGSTLYPYRTNFRYTERSAHRWAQAHINYRNDEIARFEARVIRRAGAVPQDRKAGQ